MIFSRRHYLTINHGNNIGHIYLKYLIVNILEYKVLMVIV